MDRVVDLFHRASPRYAAGWPLYRMGGTRQAYCAKFYYPAGKSCIFRCNYRELS